MGELKLKDIKIVKLKNIKNKNGNILHFLKQGDSNFKKFGEAYFSWIHPNKIKAWKMHTKTTLNLVVPHGKVKFVFFLKRINKFRTVTIGEKNYKMLIVPPGVWYGFKGISKNKSLIANITNLIHNPKEILRRNKKDIKFSW